MAGLVFLLGFWALARALAGRLPKARRGRRVCSAIHHHQQGSAGLLISAISFVVRITFRECRGGGGRGYRHAAEDEDEGTSTRPAKSEKELLVGH